MFQSERLAAVGLASRRRPNGLVASVMWLGGLVATVAAMVSGAAPGRLAVTEMVG